MRYLNLLFLLIILSGGCTHSAKSKTKDLFTFYIYGLPDNSAEKAKAEYVVAKRWGIRFKRVANCVISKELVDSAEDHNREVRLRLRKKHGVDWKTKMDKEIANEMLAQKQILDLLKSDKGYQQINNHYEKKGIYVDCWFDAKSNGIYDVALVTQDLVNNHSVSKEHAHYLINLQTRQIKRIAYKPLMASHLTRE